MRFLLSIILFSLPVLSGAATPKNVVSFFEQHCYECHDDLSAEGDLNLLDLDFAPDDDKNRVRWIEIFDRVEKGEMPPKDESRPDQRESDEFLAALRKPLVGAELAKRSTHGRTRIRRLNRSEFETSLSDLIGMPLDIQADLPEDARSHGFDTVGDALNVSSVQIEAYLAALDDVFDLATTLYERPKRRTHRLTYREVNGIMQVNRKGGPFHIREDGVAFFATEKFSHLNAVMSQWTAPHTARYRVKVSAYALRSDEPVILSLRAGGTGHAESNHVPHVFLKHMPVREGEPQVFEWEGWLERGHYFHVYPTSLPPMRFAGKNEELRQGEYEGPAAVVQWVEVDGPIFEDWPPKHHRSLWAETATKPIPDAEPNKDPIEHLDHPPSRIAKPRITIVAPDKETGNRRVYDPKQGIGGEPIHRAAPIPKALHATREFSPADPKAKAEQLVRRLAKRAWRTPDGEEELDRIVALVHRWLDEGSTFENAVRTGFKAILVSPQFLYHQSTIPDGTETLGGVGLAERLSFFLTQSGPDDRLRKLGREGKLADPEVLRVETERLLESKNAERFLDHFLAQWLDLRLIDFTVPDEKLYPEYDKLLQWSMVEETSAFVRRLLQEDLPISNLIDSDFAMLNWRLAKHYGLPPLDGMEVEPVALPEDSIRGGLLTQGSILKVTANGTTTSPIVRGVWLMERLLGEHPAPPPPGIPAIEPDIRGAVSIRDQLEKHRNSQDCAACHAKIDPPGMALESFDVIGGWRKNYRALNEELADFQPRYSPFQPVPIRYVEGPPVDASYQLADGRAFEDIEDFRQLLLENPRQIARGFAEKLIVYSTGAAVSFAERDELEAILDRSEDSGYGLRTLLHETVQSPLFRLK